MAHNLNGGALTALTHRLATASEVTAWGKERWTRRNDPRIQRMAEILCSLPRPDIVCFEDVQFSSYTLQCQLWASFRTVIWLTLGKQSLLECVPVSTLKLFAAQHGGANKKAMAAALLRYHPEIDQTNLDDNAIDALWIYKWAQTHLSRANLCQNQPRKLHK